MSFPQDLRYTKTHEWTRRQDQRLRIGITDYAQKEISDVVFVELPKLDQTVEQFKAAAVVESVKAAFDIYAPVSGKVTRVNSQLENNPGLVNQDCYGEGWFFELEISNPSEWDSLFTSEAYARHLKQDVK